MFTAITAFVLVKKNTKTAGVAKQGYVLQPRVAALAYTAEWASVQNNAGVLTNKIKSNPADIKSLMALAALFIQEGRSTGNLNYYNKAAASAVEEVLKIEPNNFEALTFKSTILLSQHQFEYGKQIAEQARDMYPQNASMAPSVSPCISLK